MRSAYLFKRPRRRHTAIRLAAVSLALGVLAVVAAPDIAMPTVDQPRAASVDRTASADLTYPVSVSAASRDMDCADFDNQWEAQHFFDAQPGNRHRLDADHDGIACETLP